MPRDYPHDPKDGFHSSYLMGRFAETLFPSLERPHKGTAKDGFRARVIQPGHELAFPFPLDELLAVVSQEIGFITTPGGGGGNDDDDPPPPPPTGDGSGVGTGSGSDDGSGSGDDSGSGSGSDSGSGSGSDSGSGSGSDSGTGSGTGTGTGTGSGSGSGSGGGGGGGSGSGGTGTGSGSDSGSGYDSGSGTGMDSGTGTGTDQSFICSICVRPPEEDVRSVCPSLIVREGEVYFLCGFNAQDCPEDPSICDPPCDPTNNCANCDGALIDYTCCYSNEEYLLYEHCCCAIT